MFKLICVDEKLRPGEKYFCDFRLKEGEIYHSYKTVTGYSWDPETGIATDPRECYKLSETISRPDVCFETNRFIPVSDIDETEMIREYNTEKV